VEKLAEEKPAKRTARSTSKTTTSLGTGRRKTVYRITSVGEAMFTEMLEETAAAVDTEHFTLKLAFFRYLKPETRLALLERRRAYLQEKLQQFKTNMRDYRERIDSYTLSLQNHSMAATQSDIEWIDELILHERSIEGGAPNPTNA
jgi:DNA-binding PadR family transcriptional regulator